MSFSHALRWCKLAIETDMHTLQIWSWSAIKTVVS